jgi:hypothetical protein
MEDMKKDLKNKPAWLRSAISLLEGDLEWGDPDPERPPDFAPKKVRRDKQESIQELISGGLISKYKELLTKLLPDIDFEYAEYFEVLKKDKTMRAILDCRPANARKIPGTIPRFVMASVPRMIKCIAELKRVYAAVLSAPNR